MRVSDAALINPSGRDEVEFRSDTEVKKKRERKRGHKNYH